jgi:hypothetical protein
MRKVDIVTPVECPQLTPERQLLWDAANYIDRVGWCQNGYERSGAVCAVKAIWLVEGHKDSGAQKLLHKHLGLPPGATTSWWNDRIASTQAEVIQALRDAALS